ncbi:MAG: aminodeoxychorismate synthase component I [Bacteroidales bacterium]|nr:aminodeoxychorismate synthase component I [Bacteroidales bacterium]
MDFFQQMTAYGQQKIPFLFVIDFEEREPFICPLNQIDVSQILYAVKLKTNAKNEPVGETVFFSKNPISRKTYFDAFEKVIHHINRGDSYLLNLTFPSSVDTNLSLREIFYLADAPYKLFMKDKFVCFSPESFVQIRDGKIFSYPMKGTIDAGLKNSEALLLNDRKELAEHYTIVDLIRNDLSQVARNVQVNKFRYVEKIITNGKSLLQTSSEISGDLLTNDLGAIFKKLLPAGSISGAPKQKTMEIIQNVEITNRGFYTGVFGMFNGKTLDSAVMIRFVAQNENKLFYHSGGGIVSHSNPEKEFAELVDKIYLPVKSH